MAKKIKGNHHGAGTWTFTKPPGTEPKQAIEDKKKREKAAEVETETETEKKNAPSVHCTARVRRQGSLWPSCHFQLDGLVPVATFFSIIPLGTFFIKRK